MITLKINFIFKTLANVTIQNGIRLMPSAPTYEPLYFSNKEIEKKPIKIIGRVLENRQKY